MLPPGTKFCVISILMLLVLIAFSWKGLNELNTRQKIVTIGVLLVIALIITIILVTISSNGIEYEKNEAQKEIKRIFITIFTPINGIVFMPYLTKIINLMKKNEEIEKNKKRLMRLIIIDIIIFILEIKYLRNAQLEILNIAQNIK